MTARERYTGLSQSVLEYATGWRMHMLEREQP